MKNILDQLQLTAAQADAATATDANGNTSEFSWVIEAVRPHVFRDDKGGNGRVKHDSAGTLMLLTDRERSQSAVMAQQNRTALDSTIPAIASPETKLKRSDGDMQMEDDDLLRDDRSRLIDEALFELVSESQW